jgi:hypothetical protein
VEFRKDQTNLSDASDESLLTIVRDEMFVNVRLRETDLSQLDSELLSGQGPMISANRSVRPRIRRGEGVGG